MERRKFWFERTIRNNEKRYGIYRTVKSI
jgi:hypothetical protein